MGAPLALAMGLYGLFNVVDAVMISGLPNAGAALAALAVCDMVGAVAAIVGNGLSTAAAARIAERLGRDDRPGVARAIVQSTQVVVLLSVVFGLVGVMGSDWVVRTLVRTRGEPAAIAVSYLQVTVGGALSIFALLQLTAVLRALGYAGLSASLFVAGNLLNVVFNGLLIYGQGPRPAWIAVFAPLAEALGAPALGVLGAAVGTVLARMVPVAIGSLWLLAHMRKMRLNTPSWPWSRDEMRSLWSVAWPVAAQQLVHVLAILAFIALINVAYTRDHDATVLTAYGICLRLETFVLFVCVGWGSGAATYMGVSRGAGKVQRAVRAGWIASGYGLLSGLALYYAYSRWGADLIAFFDADPEVVADGRRYLAVVALSYPLLGAGTVLSLAMSGAGATRPGLVVDALAFWALAIPLSLLLVFGLGGMEEALFLAIALGNAAAGLGFIVYYRSRASAIAVLG